MEVIGLNLLLADWGDEDHHESILAERNSKWGREYLTNVKCVWKERQHHIVSSRKKAVCSSKRNPEAQLQLGPRAPHQRQVRARQPLAAACNFAGDSCQWSAEPAVRRASRR